MNPIDFVGKHTIQGMRQVSDFYALLTILLRARFRFSHRSRRRIFRMLYNKQLFYTGVIGQFINIVIAILIGVLLVFRLPAISSGENIVPALSGLFTSVIVRELAPMMCSLVLVAGAGTAVTAKIGFLKVFHEFETLRGMGIDPVHLFLVPVFFALPLSILLLVLVFDAVAFASAYLTLLILEHGVPLEIFFHHVVDKIEVYDILIILIKCILSSLIIGFYAIFYGSNMRPHATHVAKTLSDSTTQQFVLVFALNVIASILAYL